MADTRLERALDHPLDTDERFAAATDIVTERGEEGAERVKEFTGPFSSPSAVRSAL